MSEYIEIELQIVEPIFIELETSPEYYIGTKQVGPKGDRIELQMNGTVLQWRYVGEIVWKDLFDMNEHTSVVTFEALLANGDIGYAADQVSPGDHDHEIGDMEILFENNLI